MTCPLNDPRHEECPGCGDCIRKGIVSYLKLPRLDPGGGQMYEPITGVAMHVMIPMESHVAAHSAFNATGLVAANPLCTHGLMCPDDVDPGLPGIIASRIKGTIRVVRSKYLDGDGRCPVCRGEPAPPDMITPRA